MNLLWGILFLTGIYPLGLAWRANRLTTLGHPLMWASLAWAAWTEAAWLEFSQAGLITYVAVCLTGCSGVAVLGARRPGVGAWNFVVAGLLVVLLQPRANPRMEAAHWLFLTATLALPLLNYLPTRLGAAAVLLGLGCGLEILRLMELLPAAVPHSAGLGLTAVAPWAAWRCYATGDPRARSSIACGWRIGIASASCGGSACASSSTGRLITPAGRWNCAGEVCTRR